MTEYQQYPQQQYPSYQPPPPAQQDNTTRNIIIAVEGTYPYLSNAVHLLDIDTHSTEKTENIRTENGSSSISVLDIGQPVFIQ